MWAALGELWYSSCQRVVCAVYVGSDGLNHQWAMVVAESLILMSSSGQAGRGTSRGLCQLQLQLQLQLSSSRATLFFVTA